MKIGLIAAAAAAVVGMTVGCAAPMAAVHGAESEAPEATLLSAAVPTAPAETTRDVPKREPESLPNACSAEQSIKDTKACLPPPAFAKKLCGGVYPEVALSMFAKGTPWTRIWLAGDVEAWNASGGRTHRAKLAFDEEVIVLARHGAGGGSGIMMTGAMASYDVLRWDGTCVSVMEGELTTRRPPAPKPASVPWSRLDEMTRTALLTSPKVKATHGALGRTCAATDKKACEKADKTFASSIADYVRSGASLPTPARRP